MSTVGKGMKVSLRHGSLATTIVRVTYIHCSKCNILVSYAVRSALCPGCNIDMLLVNPINGIAKYTVHNFFIEFVPGLFLVGNKGNLKQKKFLRLNDCSAEELQHMANSLDHANKSAQDI